MIAYADDDAMMLIYFADSHAPMASAADYAFAIRFRLLPPCRRDIFHIRHADDAAAAYYFRHAALLRAAAIIDDAAIFFHAMHLFR